MQQWLKYISDRFQKIGVLLKEILAKKTFQHISLS